MEVIRIHQVIELVPNKCFSLFVNDVTAARHEGDKINLKVFLESYGNWLIIADMIP